MLEELFLFLVLGLDLPTFLYDMKLLINSLDHLKQSTARSFHFCFPGVKVRNLHFMLLVGSFPQIRDY